MNDEDRQRSSLSAQLVFEISSFEGIRDAASEKMASILNCLAYTTNKNFKIVTLKRVIDWTPGTIDRDIIVFVETPEFDRAEPDLTDNFVDTAQRLLASQSGEQQAAAMRWYRRGIGAQQLEDQFLYFWFALEIASETQKGTERVASKCPHCRNPLYCEVCNRHPQHRPYPGEAIRQMADRVRTENEKDVFDALQTIRHTLMHGGRIASIESKLPFDAETAVDLLAITTWRALSFMFDELDPTSEAPLNFGDPGSVVRRTIVASANFSVRLRGDPNNPQIEELPDITFEMIRTPNTNETSEQTSA